PLLLRRACGGRNTIRYFPTRGPTVSALRSPILIWRPSPMSVTSRTGRIPIGQQAKSPAFSIGCNDLDACFKFSSFRRKGNLHATKASPRKLLDEGRCSDCGFLSISVQPETGAWTHRTARSQSRLQQQGRVPHRRHHGVSYRGAGSRGRFPHKAKPEPG